MSTSQSALMLCGWEVKAGMVHSTCGCTCGWQEKLCDPSLTRAIPERFRHEFLMISAIQIGFLLPFNIQDDILTKGSLKVAIITSDGQVS